MAVFDLQDASFKGDPRWSSSQPWTRFAPIVVLALFILSIVQIALGAVLITSVPSIIANLSFAQVIQPLIVPGLSFFNTVPSLHLHVLARSNSPVLAMWFSSILCVVYLASAIVFLPPCSGSNYSEDTRTPSAYQRAECPFGTKMVIRTAVVALQFVSALGYALHFAMAAAVKRAVKRREEDEREGRALVVIDEVAKARREEEARRRWQEMGDL